MVSDLVGLAPGGSVACLAVLSLWRNGRRRGGRNILGGFAGRGQQLGLLGKATDAVTKAQELVGVDVGDSHATSAQRLRL